MLKLKSVNFEQQQFQDHHLDGRQEWVIGRNATCDIVLPNLEVSRVHGRIVYLEDGYHFVDVGSTSGSMLNGELIPTNEQRLIHSGDLIQIGGTFIYVEEMSPPNATSGAIGGAIGRVDLPDQPWIDGELIVRCCRIIDETPDVKTFCFAAEPPMLFSYLPGQFVNLELDIDGQSVIRPYSVSSTPTRPYHLGVTVKRVPASSPDVPPGLVSNWLHDRLQVGDRIRLLGAPLGHFTCLPDLPAKLLLISAGSGITPMMSMSRWVQDTLTDCDVVFLHSARTPTDIVFRAELEAMAAQMPNFRLAVTITQPSAGQAWLGLTGRISEFMLDWIVPDLHDRAVFVCGPEPFMEGIKSTLEAMGFPMQNYQQESFGGAKKPAKPAAKKAAPQPAARPEPIPVASNGRGRATEIAAPTARPAPPSAPSSAAPTLCFAKSGRDMPIEADATVLEMAEQEGIPLRAACRVGACGACKVRASEGQVRYETLPQALSAADQQAGYMLACVAYPDSDRLVVEA